MKIAGNFYDQCFDSFACIFVLQICQDLNARCFVWLICNFSLHGSKDWCTSVITGDQLHPDLLLKSKENCQYVLELTTSFETNLNCNANRKSEKYAILICDLKRQFKSVSFVNLSISLLGYLLGQLLQLFHRHV